MDLAREEYLRPRFCIDCGRPIVQKREGAARLRCEEDVRKRRAVLNREYHQRKQAAKRKRVAYQCRNCTLEFPYTTGPVPGLCPECRRHRKNLRESIRKKRMRGTLDEQAPPRVLKAGEYPDARLEGFGPRQWLAGAFVNLRLANVEALYYIAAAMRAHPEDRSLRSAYVRLSQTEHEIALTTDTSTDRPFLRSVS